MSIDTPLSVANMTPQANASGAANALLTAKNQKDVKQSATKFEAMFMQEMLSHMYEGMDTNGPFGGGHGEEVFRSMMIQEYGNKIANSGQTKIAPMLEKEMLRMQEDQKNPRGTSTTLKIGA
jgi:Rod binding domain-containing protein